MPRLHERLLRDALAVRHDLHERMPSWMENVIATGFGPKLVAGRTTDEFAIQFFLKAKRANKRVARTLRVPKSLEGFTTDILPGTDGVALNALSLPSASSAPIGAGFPISSSDGERGTVTCSAMDNAGQPVFITAAHYVTVWAEISATIRKPPPWAPSAQPRRSSQETRYTQPSASVTFHAALTWLSSILHRTWFRLGASQPAAHFPYSHGSIRLLG